MRNNSFFYLVAQGIKNIWYNRLMSLASIGILITCLLMVGFSIILTININKIVTFVEQQNEAVVYIKDEVSDEELKNVENELKAISNISYIKLVSKQEGLEQEKQKLGNDGDILEGLENDNPLPNSFNIKIKDLGLYQQTLSEIREKEWVEKVNGADDVAANLTSIRKTISLIGTSVIVALIFVSLVIVSNTIRASVFTRRREINIMKYVGATNSFIRLPFIVEGMALGLISSLIAFLITWLGYNEILTIVTKQSSNWLDSLYGNLIPFKNIGLDLALYYSLSGIFVGVVGSFVSIRKHIKV